MSKFSMEACPTINWFSKEMKETFYDIMSQKDEMFEGKFTCFTCFHKNKFHKKSCFHQKTCFHQKKTIFHQKTCFNQKKTVSPKRYFPPKNQVFTEKYVFTKRHIFTKNIFSTKNLFSLITTKKFSTKTFFQQQKKMLSPKT